MATDPNSTTVQHRIEDRTFHTLIKRYTERRDWEMVTALNRDFGKILEDRENEELCKHCGKAADGRDVNFLLVGGWIHTDPCYPQALELLAIAGDPLRLLPAVREMP